MSRKVDGKATGERECSHPWREAGPLNHLGDEVDPGHLVVHEEVSLSVVTLTGASASHVTRFHKMKQ